MSMANIVNSVIIQLVDVYLVVILHSVHNAQKAIHLMFQLVLVSNVKFLNVPHVLLMEQDVHNVPQDTLLTTIQTHVSLVKLDVVLVLTMD